MKSKTAKTIFEYLGMALGAILAAFAIEEFLVPCTILDGGVVGISIMVSTLTGIRLSLLTVVLNIPFLLVGLKSLGHKFIIKSASAMLIFSWALDLFAKFENATSEYLLAVSFGGVLLGIGVGLVIKFGGCLDGTETVAILLNRKFKLPVGQIVLIFNIVIYTIAGLMFGFDRAMYSLLTYFITSKILDIVETGINQAKAAMIITDHADDISKKLSSFKVLNPEQHICSMEESVKLVITLTIGKGRGWVPAEENKVENAPLGTIAIDSIFTPIINVKYVVAPCRIAQKTDYESLSLEITTDGSINPKDALLEAAKILIYHFMLFSEDKIEIDDPGKTEENALNEDDMRMRQLLNNKLTDQDLSVRAINCLKAADIETFADLVSHQKSELMKFRNFGKKSMTEIEALVDKHGLHFGMDISKYNIEK